MTKQYMDFSSLDGGANVEAPAAAPKKSAKTALLNNFAQKVQANPDLKAALFAMSNSLRVVNSCGYGEDGGLIEIKKGDPNSADGKTGREVGATSKIVGYIVENIGSEPIAFQNGVWTKNEEGIYVENVVEDVINPGEKKALDRKYLTLLAVRPEFSFTLENGKIVGSSSSKAAKGVDDLINSYHFRFKDSSMTIHDDKVKVAIADKREVTVDGAPQTQWVIKPEFEATFGYLSNPKATVRKTRAAAGEGIDFKAAAAADYVRTLLESKGVN